MSRRKLSRNRMIKAYHKATGLSYKECRARLKSINWDLGGLFNTMMPVANAVVEAMARLGEMIIEVADKVVEVISETVVPAINETVEQINEKARKGEWSQLAAKIAEESSQS